MVNALQLWIQVLGIPIASELAVMMPYILTIVVLTLSLKKGKGPSALTKAFEREG
jgi:simple sugar transport system permease protein